MSNDNSLHWKNWANLNPQQRLNVSVSLAIQNSSMCKTIHDNGYKKDFTYGVGYRLPTQRGGAYTQMISRGSNDPPELKLICDVEKSKGAFYTASFISHELAHISTIANRRQGENEIFNRIMLPENLAAWMMIEESIAFCLESEFDSAFLSKDIKNTQSLFDNDSVTQSFTNYLAVLHNISHKEQLWVSGEKLFDFICQADEMTRDYDVRAAIRQKYVKNFVIPFSSAVGNTNARYNISYLGTIQENVKNNYLMAQRLVLSNMIPKKWTLNVDDITAMYTWGDKQFLSKDQWNEVFEGMNPVSFVRRGIRNAGLGDEYNRSIGWTSQFVGLPFNPL